MIILLRQVRYFDTQILKGKTESPSTVSASSGELLNILRVADNGPAQIQSPAPLPNWSQNTNFTLDSHELPTSSSDSWPSTEEPLSRVHSRSSPVTNPVSSSPAHMAQERGNNSDTPTSDEELDPLLYEASEINTESRKSSDSQASVGSKENHGFFVACWQGLIAWICGIFARLFRRPSNA